MCLCVFPVRSVGLWLICTKSLMLVSFINEFSGVSKVTNHAQHMLHDDTRFCAVSRLPAMLAECFILWLTLPIIHSISSSLHPCHGDLLGPQHNQKVAATNIAGFWAVIMPSHEAFTKTITINGSCRLFCKMTP